MTSQEFIIWMKGFVSAAHEYAPTPKQWDILKDELSKVSDYEDREQLENDFFARIVTFGKAYGLAGLRLGMLFGSKELIAWMNKVKPPYNINQLTQNEALKRLMNVDLVQDQISFLISERERIEIEFHNYSIIEKIYPSDSNFILVKVNDANEVYNYLVLNKIISRNRTTQPLCENCIRITIGTKGENDLMLEKVKELC